jgi:hypothetical protein
MRIRIQFLTWMRLRIRIQLITLKRIWSLVSSFEFLPLPAVLVDR